MNLNPMTWWRGGRAEARANGGKVSERGAAAQGPWTGALNGWVARTVAPQLYEALREAIPPIDAAIIRLVTLDGIIRPVAESDRLQRQIRDWMDNVRVNDLAAGFQSFYALQNNELYEQGLALGEVQLREDGRDVERLWVGDSKGVFFRRDPQTRELETWYRAPAPQRSHQRNGSEQIERVLRNNWQRGEVVGVLRENGYRRLDPELLVYAAYNPEADSPYGVSLIRSLEFVGKTLLTIDNATQQVWERFGNPAFALTYKRKRKPPADDPDLSKLRGELAKNLAAVLDIKRAGNSADFVNALAADDELLLEIIGGDGQVLEVEKPARHILEQIVSKTGLPSWMLGFHWSTAERLAERQGELVLQESRTRFEGRLPGLRRVVATALRARGVTWREGDWTLEQELPSLQDLVAKAQARFLDAQTQFMLQGSGRPRDPAGREEGARGAVVSRGGRVLLPTDEAYVERIISPIQDYVDRRSHVCLHADQRAAQRHKAETYVEDGDALTRLERAAERGTLRAWWDLYDELLGVLGLEPAKAAKQEAPVFAFDGGLIARLQELERAFVARVGAEDAALAQSVYGAWLRGVANGAAELGADEILDAARETVRAALAREGLDQVRDTTARALREGIVDRLAQGAYDGENPRDVARALRERFEIAEYDWERLARSEIAAAQGRGKMDQYQAHEIEQYEWVPAGDGCPICIGLAAGGPYNVGAGPLPMTDSHPSCRCTVVAVVGE